MRTRRKIRVVATGYLFSHLFSMSITSICYATNLPDAKSIPKPILLLGLYCNSSKIVMKKGFELDPSAPPWYATGATEQNISKLMKLIDINDSGYTKAIADGAITSHEANFIKYSATHETELWLKNIRNSCTRYLGNSTEYDNCLKDNNSEIYKCYRQVKDLINITKK